MNVRLVAVYAAVRQQTQDVQRFVAGLECLHGIHQGRQFKELTAADAVINAFKVLKDNTSRPNIQVAYFRVAHLPIWQTNVMFRGIDQSVWMRGFQAVQIRGVGLQHGVEFSGLAVTKTIEDEQNDRFDRHG